MKFKATSYAMGRPLASKEFEAGSLRVAAIIAPRGLPKGGRSDGGRIVHVVGVKRIS